MGKVDLLQKKYNDRMVRRIKRVVPIVKVLYDNKKELRRSDYCRNFRHIGGLKNLPKSIHCIDPESGNILHTFNSMTEAARILGLNSSMISECTRSKTRIYGGFKWEYYI